MLGRDFLSNVARDKGRFRSFLLTCLNHFLSDERDRASAVKRGRGQLLISLDADLAEKRYREEPVVGLTPQIAYERCWAATLLERAQTRLAAEYAAHGKTDLLRRLEEFPLGERGESSFRDSSCSQCGRPLPEGTPAALCPLCSLRGALEEERPAMEGARARSDQVIAHRSSVIRDW